MRAAEFQRGEIEIERRLQFFAVPGVTAEELLVVGAFLVPVREKRAGEVEPFPIPALRDHVDLLADLFLVNLFRFVRIGNVEDAALAVAEAIDKQCFVIGAQADVDGKHAAFHVTDRRDFLRPAIRLCRPRKRSQSFEVSAVAVKA